MCSRNFLNSIEVYLDDNNFETNEEEHNNSDTTVKRASIRAIQGLGFLPRYYLSKQLRGQFHLHLDPPHSTGYMSNLFGEQHHTSLLFSTIYPNVKTIPQLKQHELSCPWRCEFH